MRRLSFFIDPVPPFRLDLTAWAIRRRPENMIDRWDSEYYQRVLALAGRPVLLSVTQTGSTSAPRIEITVSGGRLPATTRSAVTAALERLLGLRIDLRSFYRLAMQHERLRELAARFRGMKPPQFRTVWEYLVNGIACQQFSLAVGILLLNRLAARRRLPDANDAARHAFPRPEDLAAANPGSLPKIGFNAIKTRELMGLGREIASGKLDVESFERLGNQDAVWRLLQLSGVGRWTAEYVLLRGMGRQTFFPAMMSAHETIWRDG